MKLITTSWLAACISICYGQTSTVNGRAEYEGTAVATNPLGIPTMAYNCAKMPSICENVNANSARNGRGNYALRRDNNGHLGRLANVDFLEPNVDTDQDRIDNRRDQESCPGNWKANHPCPETNQPLVVPEPFNRGHRTVSNGFVGQRLSPNLPQGAAGSYQIADPSGADAGMAWTCDEFPPAFSVEGDDDANGVSANTYCAPWGLAACDGAFTLSEQDWQSNAHGTIKQRAGPTPGATGIFTIRFVADFLDDDDAWASRVDYYVEGGEAGFIYGVSELAQRRSIADDLSLVSERTFDNGTIVQLSKRVPLDHGRRNLLSSRDGDEIDEFAKRDGVPVATRTISDATLVAREKCTQPAYTKDPAQSGIENPTQPAKPTVRTSTFTTISTKATSKPSTTPTSTPDICKLTIEEIWTCEASDTNLYASMSLTDANGKKIYSTPGSTSSPGVPIDDPKGYSVKEDGMDTELLVVGEHTKDYIQFTYGDQSWTSSSTSGTPSCKLNGDNWDSSGPKCPGAAQTRTTAYSFITTG
ncbi:esterase family protein [Seiridium cupressi]